MSFCLYRILEVPFPVREDVVIECWYYQYVLLSASVIKMNFAMSTKSESYF